MKEWLQPEILSRTPEMMLLLSSLWFTLQMALNSRQKEAVDSRDEKQCVARLAGIPHRCNEKEGIERHHILPQRYAKKLGFDPDVPENIASLCKNFHRHHIHPDTLDALRSYHEKKARGENSFKDMANERAKKLANREIYWIDKWDRKLQAQVQKLNTKARKRNWKWPLSRKQQKAYGRDAL